MLPSEICIENFYTITDVKGGARGSAPYAQIYAPPKKNEIFSTLVAALMTDKKALSCLSDRQKMYVPHLSTRRSSPSSQHSTIISLTLDDHLPHTRRSSPSSHHSTIISLISALDDHLPHTRRSSPSSQHLTIISLISALDDHLPHLRLTT